MGEILKSNWLIYVIEVSLAVVIINVSFNAFLVYFLFIVLLKLDTSVDYLRKLIRVFQVSNEGKLIAVIRKLKITDEEMKQVTNDYEELMTEADLESLRKDLSSLTGGKPKNFSKLTHLATGSMSRK